jgi:hypothetical protein
MTWLTATGYLCHKWPRICCVCHNYNPVFSLFMTYHQVCNKKSTTGQVAHVEQELLTLLEHLNSHTIVSGVRVTRSLVFCAMFCRSLVVLLSFNLWSLYLLVNTTCQLHNTNRTQFKQTLQVPVFQYQPLNQTRR